MTVVWQNLVGNRWVEIDTDAVRFNYEQVKELVGSQVEIIAVVKADGYGLGALEMARIFVECGAAMLAVTTVDEALELRSQGIEHPILLLSPFLPGEEEVIVHYRLTPSVSSLAQLKALAQVAFEKVPIHIKIETGMGRTGLLPQEVESFLEELAHHPQIYLEGIFTHFAQARQGDPVTQKQWERFLVAVEKAEKMGWSIPYRHVCNSAATLDWPSMHLNMVRVGTVLYGQNPALAKNKLSLKDPWQLKARVVHLREVPSGTAIGYGGDYVTKTSAPIAVIPLGWADGMTVMPAIRPKTFLDLMKMTAKLVLEYVGRSKSQQVVIGGKKYPLVGRLGMQLSMAAVGPEVQAGQEVEIPIRRLSTNPRLPRVYFREGQPYRARLAYGEVSLAGKKSQ